MGKAPEVHEQMTVNFIERTSRALELTVRLTGDTKTNTINRAIQKNAFLEAEAARGCVLLMRNPDGTVDEVVFA
jgi:hypothetical protein